jgi:hypothetical protein
MFSGQKIWDEKVINEKIKKLSKVLDLKRDDFVDPKDLKEGFGYK